MTDTTIVPDLPPEPKLTGRKRRGGLFVTDADEPIPLAEACALFPHAKLKVSTLRAEADRGRLDIFKLGKRYYTTAKAMREMVRKCQDDGRRHGSTSTSPESSGLSETDRASSARVALNETLTALKRGLPHISARSTPRRAGQIR